MEPVWEGCWAWGLGLIAFALALHAFAVAFLIRIAQRFTASPKMTRHLRRYPILLTAGLVGFVGSVLAVFHGVEWGIWAAAYLRLGAIGSVRDAMLYSVDSMTTRGASGLVLSGEWRLLGSLEAADGMLLFGISTAFVFAVIQRIDHIFLNKTGGANT